MSEEGSHSAAVAGVRQSPARGVSLVGGFGGKLRRHSRTGRRCGERTAENTDKGKRFGLIEDRYQKKKTRTGLWDKCDKRGSYVGRKKTGGPLKSILRLIGRNPRRP